MKKFIIISLLCLFFISGIYTFKISKQTPSSTIYQDQLKQKIDVNNTPSISSNKQIRYKGIVYSFAITHAINPAKLTLTLNTQKETMKEFKNRNKCSIISSAGFYDTDSLPLGLFISRQKMLHPHIPNALLNGIFTLRNNTFYITNNPIEDPELSLQTGPVLYDNGQPRVLSILNDEHARRNVILITKDNSLYFATFYNSENTFDGPLLQDLPNVLSLVEESIPRIAQAINLDGGSASAFENESISLSELATVGSFFCEIP